MNTYKEKMAHLISLIVRIKRFSFEELEIMLEISQVQKILNMPEVKIGIGKMNLSRIGKYL